MSESKEKSQAELESIIEKLKSNINQLEETNFALTNRVSELEAENKKIIDELNQLKHKLASSGPSGKLNVVAKKELITKKVQTQKSKAWRDDKTVVVPSGRVKDLINKRHAALKGKDDSKEETEIKEEVSLPTKVQIEETPEIKEEVSLPTKVQIEETPEIGSEKEVEKRVLESASEGRRKCPKCGNNSKKHIREMTDKTKIISAYPRMYGKKYKCGSCGSEWR